MKKHTFPLLGLAIIIGLPACAVQGTQRFTPTGVKLSNSVGLGTEAFSKKEEQKEEKPTQVTYNNTTNYYDAPKVDERRTEHYCSAPQEIIVTTPSW